MQKWEYQILSIHLGGFAKTTADPKVLAEINSVGKEGWELVEVITTTQVGAAVNAVLFFKRCVN